MWRHVALVFLAGGLIGTGLAFVAASGWPSRSTGSAPMQAVVSAPQPPPPTATALVVRAGKVEINLGTRPSNYGSQAQASDLLAAMAQQPGKAEYSIAYKTESDAVVFGCDLSTETLARVHVDRAGHGTKERWSGYVMERIRGAAAGGSLNDTPAGKSPGSFEKF